jgi:hypothetical protein
VTATRRDKSVPWDGKVNKDDVDALVAYLLPESDEVAIISAVTTRDGGQERILRASVIIGPQELGETNWCGWRAAHAVSIIGQSEPDEPSYATAADSLRTYRVVADVEQATTWTTDLVTTGSGGPVGPIPAVVATVERPVAPLRISPRLGTKASTFISAAVRPAAGFFLRGQDIDARSADILG